MIATRVVGIIASFLLGIFIAPSIFLPSESHAEITSPYPLDWEGKTYPVLFTFEGEREPDILGIHACDDSCIGYPAVIFRLAYAERPSDDGTKLTVTLPMQLIAKLHGYAITSRSISSYTEPLYVTTYDRMTASFSEDELLGYKQTQYLTPVRAGCDSVTYEVHIPRDAADVYLTNAGYAWIPEDVPSPAPDSKFPIRVPLTAANQTFTLDIFTNANGCTWGFDIQQKKLFIDVQTPEDEVGYLRINIPHRLLGGNYTVLADGKSANHTILGNTEESARVIGLSEVYTVMEVEYSQKAKSVEIIGTTVVPEFDITILFAGATIAGSVAAMRLVSSKS